MNWGICKDKVLNITQALRTISADYKLRSVGELMRKGDVSTHRQNASDIYMLSQSHNLESPRNLANDSRLRGLLKNFLSGYNWNHVPAESRRKKGEAKYVTVFTDWKSAVCVGDYVWPGRNQQACDKQPLQKIN